MKKSFLSKILVYLASFLVVGAIFVTYTQVTHAQACVDTDPICDQVRVESLGFRIPSLGDLLTFAIRGFFVIAGLAALFFMLLGAFGWVTSGGDKEAVGKARNKIQAAVVGMIIIVAVLAIIWTLENVVFNRRICVGISCPVTVPGLITSVEGENFCCCLPRNSQDRNQGRRIDVYAGGTCSE
jgi:hypothetical protein